MFYFVQVYLSLVFLIATVVSMATGTHWWPLVFLIGVPQALFMLAAQSGHTERIMGRRRAVGVAAAAGAAGTILTLSIVMAIAAAWGPTLTFGSLAYAKATFYVGLVGAVGLFAAWSSAFYRQLRIARAPEAVRSVLQILTAVAAFTIGFGAVAVNSTGDIPGRFHLAYGAILTGFMVLAWTLGPWLGAAFQLLVRHRRDRA